MVVANPGAAELRFRTEADAYLRSVGRRGAGPAEFSQESTIRALVRLPRGTLLTWDIYGQRLSLFDPAGNSVRAIRLLGGGRMYFSRGIFRDGGLAMAILDRDRPDDFKPGPRPGDVRVSLFSLQGDSLGVAGDCREGEWIVEQGSG